MNLSLFLPLQVEPYGDVATRAFFSNLLQERDAPFRQVMELHAVSSHDVAGLLHYLGAECAGALSVLPEGAAAVKVPGNPKTDYDILSQRQIEDLERDHN